MKPLLLPTVIILGWVLNHNIKKNKGKDKESIDSYIKREENANFTRKKDLSNLPYIKVPFDQLPFDITLKDQNMQSKIEQYKKNIQDLSNTKMLNLIGLSNLDLKEMYGPANLEVLTIYDGNYSRYIRDLSLYANGIYEEYPKEAASICEYLIEIGTDISGTYSLLGNYYSKQGSFEKIEALYDKIPEKTSLAGKTIIKKLDTFIPKNESEDE